MDEPSTLEKLIKIISSSYKLHRRKYFKAGIEVVPRIHRIFKATIPLHFALDRRFDIFVHDFGVSNLFSRAIETKAVLTKLNVRVTLVIVIKIVVLWKLNQQGVKIEFCC